MARRSMNLLDLHVWVTVWGERLKGKIINNIYYIKDKDILLLKVRPADRSDLIVLEAARRAHFTWRIQPPGEYKAYPLVVLARKHLRGSRIERVGLVNKDRILEIRTSRGYRIIAELLPRGVIALLDENGTVAALTRELKTRDRRLRPKTEYQPPPGGAGPLVTLLETGAISGDALGECIARGKDAVRGLIRGCGIPGELAEEALYRAGIDPSSPPESIGGGDLDRIALAVSGLVKESMEGKGWIVVDNASGSPVEADPFRPEHYTGREDRFSVESYDLFDEALDRLFSAPQASNPVEDAEADAELNRLMESLRRAEETSARYREMAEKKRRIAELIAQYYDGFERLFSILGSERPETYTTGKVRATRIGAEYQVEIEGIGSFTYRLGEDVGQVIRRLYKEAGELEAKAERALSVREDILKRVDELKVKREARILLEKARRRRKYWYEKFHWTLTRNELLAIGGRDAGQNEAVVKKYLDKEDYFLHANIHGAPAVVLKTRGRSPDLQDLWDAAVLTAAYSKAWKSGLGSVEVYYVRAEQVSFSPPSGEYLAKGGIMVYGRKNYLPKPVPLRLAVGIVMNEEGVPIVFVGSEENVMDRSEVYALIAPGDLSKQEAFETLRREWIRILPEDMRHLAYAVPEEELLPRLPGRSRILRVRRGRGRGIDMGRLA
ncbi:MAG: NFACT family protein [Desulfurococcales archaeon]|nr:NFACT family protein [Desulfurococcales archaeon]